MMMMKDVNRIRGEPQSPMTTILKFKISSCPYMRGVEDCDGNLSQEFVPLLNGCLDTRIRMTHSVRKTRHSLHLCDKNA